MIISASRRTDIPAFYSDWFMNRIREGYALVRNPFNARMVTRVNLSCANVDAIVFWTRNSRPLLKHLDELDRSGYRYYFHYTLNGYPSTLEPRVPPLQDGIAAFKELSKAVGKEKVIWRFDPIILSDITSEEWLCERFESLARDLHPFTSRVNISFVDFYGKVARRLNRITENSGVRFYDIRGDAERLLRIASRLSGIARSRSMEISGCAEDVDLTQAGIASGKCVSDELDIDPLRHHCERRERPLSEEGLPMRKQQGYRTVRHLHPRLCLLLCLIRHSGVRAKQGDP